MCARREFFWTNHPQHHHPPPRAQKQTPPEIFAPKFWREGKYLENQQKLKSLFFVEFFCVGTRIRAPLHPSVFSQTPFWQLGCAHECSRPTYNFLNCLELKFEYHSFSHLIILNVRGHNNNFHHPIPVSQIIISSHMLAKPLNPSRVCITIKLTKSSKTNYNRIVRNIIKMSQ